MAGSSFRSHHVAAETAKREADVAEAYYGARLLLYYNGCATGGRQGLTSRSAIPRISMASTQARQRSTRSLTECGPSPVGRRRRKRPFAPQAELLADGVYAKRDVKDGIQKDGFTRRLLTEPGRFSRRATCRSARARNRRLFHRSQVRTIAIYADVMMNGKRAAFGSERRRGAGSEWPQRLGWEPCRRRPTLLGRGGEPLCPP